ncbi:recombinase family protein [Heliorestis convoluta]|uniref:recombinase family protein n=1 Tax=Heliorestis convoluta TaxID=356322 RepID=UPI00242A5891|nr:recombinase family protein [Heliorestis convoluta]
MRELKALGIGIYFEKENIDTLDTKSELFLTILSSMAQEESRSISLNTKWSIMKRFQRGNAHIPTTYFLGYDTDENGNLVINEEEAAVIRRIYSECLAGKGAALIAKGLMKDGILTARGNKKWTPDAVYKILTNEKFTGSALTNKTITIDYLSHKRIRNDGREQQYFIKEHHPAIISEEDWNAVQQELKRRNDMLRNPDGKYAQNYSNRSCFSNILYCAECGHPIVRRRMSSQKNGEKYLFTAWHCRTKTHPQKYKEDCKARYVWESALESEFMTLLRDLKAGKAELLQDAQQVIDEHDLSPTEKERQLNLATQIKQINEQIQKLTEQSNSSLANIYEASINHLYYEQELLQAEYDELDERRQTSKDMERHLETLLSYLDSLDERESFDEQESLEQEQEEPAFQEEIFRQVVQKGIINKDLKVTLEFKCGITRSFIANRKK